MAHDVGGTEDRLRRLEHALETLGGRVEGIEQKLALAAPGWRTVPSPSDPAAPALPRLPDSRSFSAPQLLSGLAVVCFILVIALILRTLTDNAFVERRLGAGLGIAYAAALMLLGHWARPRRFAAIYAVCGALLLFSIVIETHARLHILPAPAAYAILGTTLAALYLIGWHSSDPVLVALGLAGTCVAAAALGIPAPSYPALMLLLLIASMLANTSACSGRCLAIKWFLLALTIVVWLVWSVNAYLVLTRAPERTAATDVPWMMPLLGVGSALAIIAALREALKGTPLADPYPAIAAPVAITITAIIGRCVVLPHYGSSVLLPMLGTLTGVSVLLAAIGVAGRAKDGSPVASGLLVGALALLVAFAPGCIRSPYLALVAGALLALGMVFATPLGKSAVARMVVHLFLGWVGAAAGFTLFLNSSGEASIPNALVLILLAAVLIAHYAASRRKFGRESTGEGGGQGLVASFIADLAYRSALIPLLSGLGCVFGGTRLAARAVLVHAGAVDSAFQACQSVMVNLAALGLGVIGIATACAEVLVLAVIVALAGAAKILLYDTSHLQGLPLLCGIGSLGVMAAFGAVLWARWQRTKEQTQPVDPFWNKAPVSSVLQEHVDGSSGRVP